MELRGGAWQAGGSRWALAFLYGLMLGGLGAFVLTGSLHSPRLLLGRPPPVLISSSRSDLLRRTAAAASALTPAAAADLAAAQLSTRPQPEEKSSILCVTEADDTQVCVYGGAGMCYNVSSGDVVLFDRERAGDRFRQAKMAYQEGRWTATQRPLTEHWPLPYNTRLNGHFKSRTWAPKTAKWLDGALWISRPIHSSHAWLLGVSVFGLFQAQQRNESGLFPPIDHLILVNDTGKPPTSNFSQTLLAIATQPQTQVHFPIDFQGGPQILCAKRGALAGFKPNWFSGPRDAWELRKKAHDILGVPMNGKADPLNVTIVNRPLQFPRSMVNVEGMVEMVKGLGMRVTLMQEQRQTSVPFKEQLRIFSNTGILIMAHGAGVANLAWLPENAVVIEVFPRKQLRTTYRGMAGKRDLVYLSLSANETHHTVYKDFTHEQVDECYSQPAIQQTVHRFCDLVVKNYPFTVPLDELERLIRHARDHFFLPGTPRLHPLQR